MKSPRTALLLLVTGLLLIPIGCARNDQANRRWLETFDRYIAQEKIPQRYDTPSEAKSATASTPILLSNVLQELPAPQEWPALTQSLRDKKKQLPATETKKKIHYQLGILLLTQLQNQPEVLRREFDIFKKEIAAAKDVAINDYRLQELESSLIKNSEPENKRQLKAFEEELKNSTPVTDADLDEQLHEKGAAARLKAILTKYDAFEEKMHRRFNLKDDGRPSDAQLAQLQKLYADFGEENKPEIEWLQKWQTNPVVQRYFVARALAGKSTYTPELRVPDLVTLVGPEKAEKYLRQAFAQRVSLSFESDHAETQKLARTIALQNLKKLHVAPWNLAQERGQSAFYEAVLKQFGAPKSSDQSNWYNYESATKSYLVDLAAQGRTAEAIALFQKIDRGDTPSLSFDDAEKIIQAGQGENVLAFLRAAVQARPDFNEWYLFDALATHYGKATEKQQLLQSLLASRDIDPAIAVDLRQILGQNYLHAEQVDAAFALFQELNRTKPSSVKEAAKRVEYALDWVKLAELLQKSDWRDLAIAQANSALDYLKSGDIHEYLSNESHLLRVLFNIRQYSAVVTRSQQAIELVAKREAVKAIKPVKKESDYVAESFREYNIESILPIYLAALVETGQNEAAVQLLQTNRHWSGQNLSQMLTSLSVGKPERPLGYYVARALLATGQRDPARRILEAQMIAEHSNDGAYELYVREFGLGAIPLLDRLFAIDQFEERPLLWKAAAQADAKQWGEAEKTIRHAIAVDPTDGEEDPGDRIRSYGVLARILEGKQDTKQAKIYHNVVAAVQLAEKGDALRFEGLTTQAVALYRESLALFEDAYCIQFRLAKELMKLGQPELATEHYRKAYQLMPGSFGRVESFCFGCEKAFETPLQQNLAETIFAQQIRDNPKSPQAHYMLGYLRKEQERKGEALVEFQKAVALDPLYFNAWKEIQELTEKDADPAAYEKITLTLARLDPAQHHSRLELEEVRDAGKLWPVVREMEKKIDGLKIPDDLYDLKATREYKASRQNYGYSSDWNKLPSLGHILSQNEAIHNIESAFADLHPPEKNEAPAEPAPTP